MSPRQQVHEIWAGSANPIIDRSQHHQVGAFELGQRFLLKLRHEIRYKNIITSARFRGDSGVVLLVDAQFERECFACQQVRRIPGLPVKSLPTLLLETRQINVQRL